MRHHIYLAGPEVFLTDARTSPRDRSVPPPDCGLAISRAMEAAMRRCDAMIVT